MLHEDNDRLIQQLESLSRITPPEPATARAMERVRQTLTREDFPSTPTLTLWRTIMTHKLTRIAAILVFGLLALAYGLTWSHTAPNGFSLLSQASAAEMALFARQGITHIINEIVVYPLASRPELEARIKNSPHHEDYDQINAFLRECWLPMCTLKADGQFSIDQLKLVHEASNYVITDESWYDPETGRFARIMRQDKRLIFANSFDGQRVYQSAIASLGTGTIESQPTAEGFRAPEEPAHFLGMMAGFKFDKQALQTDIQSVTQTSLADGTPVTEIKAGFKSLYGQSEAYWIFRIRQDNQTVAEMVFYLYDQPQVMIRRVRTETIAQSPSRWDLSEYQTQPAAATEAPTASIQKDIVIPDATVAHMVKRASFETYSFNAIPSWTRKIDITDCFDPTTPGERMFFVCCPAEDHRHVVLCQCVLYNKMMGDIFRKGKLVYESPTGVKVWAGGPEKWYSEILLQSARYVIKDPPAENRIGYGIETPSGTMLSIAINGPISDAELKALIDSIVPARDLIKP